MKLIAGLGNPGPRYADSRHNVGYTVADALALRWGTEVSRYESRFEGLVGQANVGPEVVWLLKPTTFMNLSGQSVSAVCRYYKLTPADLLVIYDDLDLPLGRLRLRAAGSAGGHKGLADVLRRAHTDEVARLRIGIGRVHPSATTEYVLARFEPDERPVIAAAIETAADAAQRWLTGGIEAAMNEFNRKPEAESRGDRPAVPPPSQGD